MKHTILFTLQILLITWSDFAIAHDEEDEIKELNAELVGYLFFLTTNAARSNTEH